jgi:hypothetical protein
MPIYDLQLIKDLNGDSGSANDVRYDAFGQIAEARLQALLQNIPGITFPYDTDDPKEIKLVSYLAYALFMEANNDVETLVNDAESAILSWFNAKYNRPKFTARSM